MYIECICQLGAVCFYLCYSLCFHICVRGFPFNSFCCFPWLNCAGSVMTYPCILWTHAVKWYIYPYTQFSQLRVYIYIFIYYNCLMMAETNET
jgi:hypothetical protein